MKLVAVKISDFDSTCLGAAIASGRVWASPEGSSDDLCSNDGAEWAAIPDTFLGFTKIKSVDRKYDSYLRLKYPDGSTKEVKRFIDESPEVAIKEAIADFEYDGLDIELLANWEGKTH